MKLIEKNKVVEEIRRYKRNAELYIERHKGENSKLYHSFEMEKNTMCELLSFLDTLEVKDPYEQCIQYDSIKAGIQAHAEIYSFNIESLLFNQLTEEQQALWRKEIEQACISGGEYGVEIARDPRYEENVEVKDVDLEKEYEEFVVDDPIFGNFITNDTMGMELARHFYELGLKAKGE